MEMKKLQVQIPAEVHDRFKAHCALSNVTMAAVIVKLLGDYMKGHNVTLAATFVEGVEK